jgi:hypothetical protein
MTLLYYYDGKTQTHCAPTYTETEQNGFATVPKDYICLTLPWSSPSCIIIARLRTTICVDFSQGRQYICASGMK